MQEQSKNTPEKSDLAQKIADSFQLTTPVLNGIVGNYLSSTGNDLATKPGFYKENTPISFPQVSPSLYPRITSRVCIFVHGLACDENYWTFKDEDGSQTSYGKLLDESLQFTSFFFRYNTGRHISENGKLFHDVLTELCENYPLEINELIIIGYSMGGLVTRSACFLAENEKGSWIKSLSKVILIGSPHLGAPLEKFCNIVTNVFDVLPQSYMNLAGNIINLRSSGIKDLRYGIIVEEDWKGKEEDALLQNNRTDVPFPEGIPYYIISGTLTENPKNLLSEWFGDALVRKNSAIAKDILEATENNYKEFPAVGHTALGRSQDVFQTVKEWCSIDLKNVKQIELDNAIIQSEKENPLCPEKLKGLSQLVETSIKEGSSSIEEVHKDLMNKPYNVIEKLFPGITVTEKIQEMHNQTVGSVYSSIRIVNKEINRLSQEHLEKKIQKNKN